MKKGHFKKIVSVLFIFNFLFVYGLSAAPEIPQLADKNVVISMDFQNASLKDVMKVLSMQSGLNFIASEAVSDREVTLYFDKAPLKEAMDKIFKANNLAYDLDESARIFIVRDLGKPSVETVTKVFYLKHATVSTASIKEEMKNIISSSNQSNIQTLSSSGTISSASAGGSSSGEEKGKWETEKESGITIAVRKILSEHGSVIEDFRTNSLIVTDVPSKMGIITQVIHSLDIAVPQVMMEVEILDVSKNVVDALGIKFSGSVITAAMSNPAAATLGFPFSSWGKIFVPSTGATLTVGSTLAAQLDWLRTQTDTKYLARPRILAMNNETAEIKITTNEAIGVKTATAAVGGAVGSETVEAERYETGVSLRVTPQINLDGGEITMFIFPQISEASTTQVTFTAGANNARYSFLNPEVRSTKATVRVKDGETVVLGGLIRNQNTTVITKVPILGDIPILGALFRHKNQTTGSDRELLVFITPHIINSESASARPVKSSNIPVPLREQAAVSVISRQQSVSNYLNTLEKKY